MKIQITKSFKTASQKVNFPNYLQSPQSRILITL